MPNNEQDKNFASDMFGHSALADAISWIEDNTNILLVGETCTTYAQDVAFADAMFGTDKLDEAIDWMQGELEPTEVFDIDEVRKCAVDVSNIDDLYADQDIVDYVVENLAPNEVFKDDEIIEYVAWNSHPEEVFAEAKLAEWAEANGYVKE